MSIKIGDKTFATKKPSDLDAKLLELSGCNAAETVDQLRAYPAPGHVARALSPFVADATVLELATEIEAAGTSSVIPDVIKLYAPDEVPAPTGDAAGKSAAGGAKA